MSLVRALDLLEYYRREAEATRKAQQAAARGSTVSEYEEEEWRPLSEEEAEGRFNFARNLPGISPTMSRMPEELRDMVRWAEEQVQKMRGQNN